GRLLGAGIQRARARLRRPPSPCARLGPRSRRRTLDDRRYDACELGGPGGGSRALTPWRLGGPPLVDLGATPARVGRKRRVAAHRGRRSARPPHRVALDRAAGPAIPARGP